MSLELSSLDVDNVGISAYPLITDINDYRLLVGTTPTVKLEGDNFEYTTSVYLSTDTGGMYGQPLTSFTNFDALSTSNYTVYNDNIMYVTFPEVLSSGFANIIVENDAGYVVSDVLSVISV